MTLSEEGPNSGLSMDDMLDSLSGDASEGEVATFASVRGPKVSKIT